MESEKPYFPTSLSYVGKTDDEWRTENAYRNAQRIDLLNNLEIPLPLKSYTSFVQYLITQDANVMTFAEDHSLFMCLALRRMKDHLSLTPHIITMEKGKHTTSNTIYESLHGTLDRIAATAFLMPPAQPDSLLFRELTSHLRSVYAIAVGVGQNPTNAYDIFERLFFLGVAQTFQMYEIPFPDRIKFRMGKQMRHLMSTREALKPYLGEDLLYEELERTIAYYEQIAMLHPIFETRIIQQGKKDISALLTQEYHINNVNYEIND